MTDIRFQSFEDGELADIWYALADASARHPGHFFGLANAILEELQERAVGDYIPGLTRAISPSSRRRSTDLAQPQGGYGTWNAA